MAEPFEEPDRKQRVTRSLVTTLFHGVCWLALLGILWGPVSAWRDLEEVPLLPFPTLFEYVLEWAWFVAIVGTILLPVDFVMLRWFDRPGWRRFARECWSAVFVTPAVLGVFVTAEALLAGNRNAMMNASLAREGEAIWNPGDGETWLQRMEQLEGEWKLVGLEDHGQLTADTDLPTSKLIIRRFESDRISPGLADDPLYRRVVFQYHWILDRQNRRGQIGFYDTTSERISLVDYSDATEHRLQIGVCRRENGQLKLCLAPPGIGGYDVPTTFSTTERGDEVLYIFELAPTIPQ